MERFKMDDHLIDFEGLAWESPAPGVRYKAYTKDGQRIRLAEFSQEFAEVDWCTKGHFGYVLEGRISIDFNGKTVDFNSGDGLFIPEGERNKHKARIAPGKKALLLLFENVG